MKKTKEEHQMWTEYQKFPKELKDKLMSGCLIGRWHYHYENKNGIIGLVRIQCGVNFTKSGKWKMDNMMWEACGVLDFQRFATKKEAEIAIYKTLKEKYP